MKNYTGVVIVAIVTLLVVVFVLAPMLEPNIGEIKGQILTPSEWIASFMKWCIAAIGVCMASLVAWIFLSKNRYPIDLAGNNTQRPYWILHALPPLVVGVAGFFLQQPIAEGGMLALATILVPIIVQYWISSILFSPNPRSVIGSGLIRRK